MVLRCANCNARRCRRPAILLFTVNYRLPTTPADFTAKHFPFVRHLAIIRCPPPMQEFGRICRGRTSEAQCMCVISHISKPEPCISYLTAEPLIKQFFIDASCGWASELTTAMFFSLMFRYWSTDSNTPVITTSFLSSMATSLPTSVLKKEKNIISALTLLCPCASG